MSGKPAALRMRGAVTSNARTRCFLRVRLKPLNQSTSRVVRSANPIHHTSM
jgi:hypothetical protein